jgi:RNA polymerase primary sigma factor
MRRLTPRVLSVCLMQVRLIREDINAVLHTLPSRERNVIRMRYGLNSPEGKIMTLNDLSMRYGLTRERIRQIEDKALTKLRRPWRVDLLRSGGRCKEMGAAHL